VKRRSIPIWVAVPILFGFASFLYGVVSRASERAVQTPPRIGSDEECLRCHNTAEAIRKMQEKRGDPTYRLDQYHALLAQEQKNPKRVARVSYPSK
jgi:hypothetical protein